MDLWTKTSKYQNKSVEIIRSEQQKGDTLSETYNICIMGVTGEEKEDQKDI